MARPRKPTSKPKKSAKKASSRGSGKRAKVKYPASTATYDRASGRWRSGGRWVPAPTLRQARKDAAGRPIDARGKRIPAGALSPAKASKPSKSPKSSKPRKLSKSSKPRKSKLSPDYSKQAAILPIPPRLRVVPRIREIRGGSEVVSKEFVSSTFENRREPDYAGEILKNVIEAHSAKGPFQASDVSIYNYGVKLVGHESVRPILAQLYQGIPTGASLEFSETRMGTEVYVRFNQTGDAQLIDGVDEHLSSRRVQEYLTYLYTELLDYWGDLDWYVWAETDELLYA